MSKTIKEIEKELQALVEQKAAMESMLVTAISEAMMEVAKLKPMQRLGEHCFIIKFSDLVGNPWNPEFYDWEKSVQIVIKFLTNKPVERWAELLENKLSERKSRLSPVVFEFRRRGNFGSIITENIPVSAEFISKIIEKLS